MQKFPVLGRLAPLGLSELSCGDEHKHEKLVEVKLFMAEADIFEDMGKKQGEVEL